MNKEQQSKIVFILGGLNYGGAERVASLLINYWHQNGYDITLISRRGPENDFFEVPKTLKRITLGGEGASANKITALFKNIPYVLRLRNAIKQADGEIVISFLTKTNIHTILACRGLGKKVVISERNDTTRQDYPWPWPTLRRWIYKHADVVTANSSIALEGMKSYVTDEKLLYVPNPVIIPDNTATPEQSKMMLNVGRLVPQKRQDLILKAFSHLPIKHQKNWTCEILGDGEEKNNLLQIAENFEITNRVKLHGLVDNPSQYYKKAGIFILASEYEGTPNVLLEAMAHGLPCIVSDSLPGALKYVEDEMSGFVFRAGDAKDLSKKIRKLTENPDLRKKLGVEARKRVKVLALENVMPVWKKIISD